MGRYDELVSMYVLISTVPSSFTYTQTHEHTHHLSLSFSLSFSLFSLSRARSPDPAPKGTDGCATDIRHFDLELGLGRSHRYCGGMSECATKHTVHKFGFGLSYTTFAYSDLMVSASSKTITVSYTVANTGKIAASEVVQVYMKLTGEAAKQGQPVHNLVGFKMHHGIPAGTSVAGTMVVDHESFATAMADGTRLVVPGAYVLSVGGHQPGDVEGQAASGNVLSATVHIK